MLKVQAAESVNRHVTGDVPVTLVDINGVSEFIRYMTVAEYGEGLPQVQQDFANAVVNLNRKIHALKNQQDAEEFKAALAALIKAIKAKPELQALFNDITNQMPEGSLLAQAFPKTTSARSSLRRTITPYDQAGFASRGSSRPPLPTSVSTTAYIKPRNISGWSDVLVNLDIVLAAATNGRFRGEQEENAQYPKFRIQGKSVLKHFDPFSEEMIADDIQTFSLLHETIDEVSKFIEKSSTQISDPVFLSSHIRNNFYSAIRMINKNEWIQKRVQELLKRSDLTAEQVAVLNKFMNSSKLDILTTHLRAILARVNAATASPEFKLQMLMDNKLVKVLLEDLKNNDSVINQLQQDSPFIQEVNKLQILVNGLEMAVPKKPAVQPLAATAPKKPSPKKVTFADDNYGKLPFNSSAANLKAAAPRDAGAPQSDLPGLGNMGVENTLPHLFPTYAKATPSATYGAMHPGSPKMSIDSDAQPYADLHGLFTADSAASSVGDTAPVKTVLTPIVVDNNENRDPTAYLAPELRQDIKKWNTAATVVTYDNPGDKPDELGKKVKFVKLAASEKPLDQLSGVALKNRVELHVKAVIAILNSRVLASPNKPNQWFRPFVLGGKYAQDVQTVHCAVEMLNQALLGRKIEITLSPKAVEHMGLPTAKNAAMREAVAEVVEQNRDLLNAALQNDRAPLSSMSPKH